MHNIARLTFVAALIFCLPVCAKADCWKRQFPIFPTETLHAMVFTSPSDGIVVGDGGLIARTADSGTNWTLLNYITTEQLRTVAFPTALKGWAGGSRGTLLQTTDGGYTWNISPGFHDSININSVSFRSADTGYVAGDSCVWYTYNGGLTWSRYVAAYSFKYVKAFASDTVYAYSNYGPLLRSYNNGQTWSVLPTSTYYQVAFANPRIGWAIQHPTGNNDYYYKTTNGGTTWTLQNTVFNSSPNYSGMHVLDTNNVFIQQSGNGGVHGIVYTNNGGTTWINSPSASSYMTCLYFTSPTTGAMGNLYGTIVTTTAPASTYTIRTNVGVPNVASHMETIDFSDTLHGIVAGGTRTYRTLDGGKTWVPGGGLANNSFAVSVQMVDSLHAWLVGDEGSLFMTANGGVSWGNTSYYNNDAHFYSANFGMSATTSDVRVTRNAGTSWTSVLAGTGFGAITCSDSLHWFAQTSNNSKAIYKSSNAGATWSLVSTSNNTFIDIIAPDTARVYSSHSTNMGKSTNGGLTFTDKYPNNWATGAILSNAKISFYDSLHGMATATGGLLIAKTGDAALTWQTMSLNSMSGYMSVAYEDTFHAWLCTNFGSIYRYYATCPSNPSYAPMLNRSALFGCSGNSYTVAIANWSTYTTGDTLTAVLKQGTTTITVLTINSSGQVTFILPATAGAYTLEVKLVNAANPTGITRSIPIAVQSTTVTPTISISTSATTVCSGTAVTYSSAITNGGTSPAYQWKVNTTNAGTNASTFNYTPANGDIITCVLTSNASCTTTATATSGSITMTVNPTVTPSATIAANPIGTICSGTPVTFTVTPANGGAAPTYQWKVNNTNVGTGGGSYTYAPSNNDSIICVLSSSVACPTTSSTPSNKITMTVVPSVTPSVSVTTPTTTICPGTTVTFNATPSNGGTTPSFLWKVNSTSVGIANSFAYQPANGDTIVCIVGTSANCATTPTATSNSIIMAVLPMITPLLTVNTASATVCAGTSVTFTTSPTNGGSSPAYQWKVNGSNAGTNSGTYAYTPSNGDTVRCVLTSNATCASTSTANSNSVIITVLPNVTPSVSITTTSTSACAGTSVTFSANPTNGGSTPSYQWKVNNTNVGTGGNAYTYAPSNGDSIICILSSSAVCPAIPSTSSNKITMAIIPTVTPSVTVTTPATPVCSGTMVTFNATPSNGGASPSFLWKVNSTSVGIANSFAYQPANGDTIVCILGTSANCATTSTATSNSTIMTVLPIVTPSLSVNTASATVCAGTSATFTTTPTNGGSSPAYQWRVNGSNAGTNSSTYAYTPANGDTVRCVLTSNAMCTSTSTANSNNIIITVVPNVTPSLGITASSTAVCAATSVNFSASPANGGGSPSYQWKVNGTNVGTGGSSYTYNPSNNDTVRCVLTSSVTCTTNATATSNNILMNVTPLVTPSVVIASSANNICAGTSVSFGATPANGGSTPVYQWKVNSSNAGTNSSSYSYTPSNGDTVSCILTSNAACPSPSSISGNIIVMAVNPVVTPAVNVTVAPNDSICAGVAVTATAGIVAGGASPVYQWKLNNVNVGTNAPVYSSSSLVNGDVLVCNLTSTAACATTNTATSVPLTMTVHALPTPVITRSGNTLSTSPVAANYTWFLNGNIVSGAVGQSYAPSQNGSYTVTLTDSNGCSGSSPAFNVAYVGVGLVHPAQEISYYPNPAQTYVSVVSPNPVNVRLLSMDGRTVFYQKNVADMDIRLLPDGVYTIQITNSYDQDVKFGKLVKLTR